MTLIKWTCWLAVAVLVVPDVATAGDQIVLQPLSRAELRSSKVHGTGCYWVAVSGRAVRLGMVGEVAVAKLQSRVIRMRPSVGARDMFPFTHDRWTDGKVEINVRLVGDGRQTGLETISTPTAIMVVKNGRTVRLQGVMRCGS